MPQANRVAWAAPRALLLVLSVGLSAGCRSVSPPGVYFDSEPRGAEILVDGRRSGYVTPHLVALDEDERFLISLTLPGYEPREFALDTQTNRAKLGRDETAIAINGYPFIIGLDTADLFLPYLQNSAHAPSRIFLRLRPATAEH